MPAADLEVRRVVSGRDLHRPRAERRVDCVVGDDGNEPVHQRQPDLAPDEAAIALVIGMHRHGGVAEHRLGPGGGHHQAAAAVGQGIPQVPEPPLGLLLLGLLVGKGGETAGTPVDDVVPAVDQTLLVQPHEGLAYRPREPFVEREVGPRPVRRAADRLELLEDRGAGAAHVGPHPLDECLPAQVEPGQPLLGLEPLDHVLGRDARVIGTGEPERAAAAHALEADQHVLHRVVEAVPRVQLSGDVGRRHHDDVWLGGAAGGGVLGSEQSPVLPPGIEGSFDLSGIVLRRERLGHAVWSLARGSSEAWSSSPRTRMLLMTLSMPGTASALRPATVRAMRLGTQPRSSTTPRLTGTA